MKLSFIAISTLMTQFSRFYHDPILYTVHWELIPWKVALILFLEPDLIKVDVPGYLEGVLGLGMDV